MWLTIFTVLAMVVVVLAWLFVPSVGAWFLFVWLMSLVGVPTWLGAILAFFPSVFVFGVMFFLGLVAADMVK